MQRSMAFKRVCYTHAIMQETYVMGNGNMNHFSSQIKSCVCVSVCTLVCTLADLVIKSGSEFRFLYSPVKVCVPLQRDTVYFLALPFVKY